MSKIIINRQSVLNFQERASKIASNIILPILSNIKLERLGNAWQLVKSNMECLCIGKIQAEGDLTTTLLDEQVFFGFINTTVAETITVEVNQVITLSDGNIKIELPVEDPVKFPLNPEYDTSKPKVKITAPYIRAIKIAAQFTTDDKNSGNFQYVHTSPAGIFGFHNSYFYINTAFTGLPDISLTRPECELISAEDNIKFIDEPKYHVFFISDYTYIFTKPEAKPLNISGVVERLKLPGKDVVLNQKELIDFCQIANLVAETPASLCTLESSGKIYLKDAAYGRSADRVLQISGQPDNFSFNSRILKPVFQAIPYETLEAKTNQNCFIIAGRNGSGNGQALAPNEWFCFIGMQ